MLRTLRRRLRLIHYYSASPEETAWTKAADAVLFGSLLLALPMVLLCDVSITRPSLAEELQGALERANNGEVAARLIDPEGPAAWSPDMLGRFNLRMIEVSRGWPMATSILTRPVRIEYDLYHEPEKRFDRGEAKDEPMREAIGAALSRANHSRMFEMWRRGSPMRTNEPLLRWFFGAGAWWVFLYAAGMAGLGASRLAAILWQRQSAARIDRLRSAGRCANCGYDLRGTEFSERCPECGELAG